MNEAEWPGEEEARTDITNKMHGNGAPARWGDRRQKLAFIGTNLDEAALIAQLDAYLLTDAKMATGSEARIALADPSPAWAYGDYSDEDGDDEHDHQHDGNYDRGHRR